MDGKFFIVKIVLDRKDNFTLWGGEDDADRFYVQEGKVVIFAKTDELFHFVETNGIKLYELDTVSKKEPFTVLNLDKLAHWVKHPTKHINTSLCLNAWNYAGDLDATIPFGFEKYQGQKNKLVDKIYDKLFAAQNLPAFSPNGQYYIPIWKQSEVLLLRDIMRDAVAGFRKILLTQ